MATKAGSRSRPAFGTGTSGRTNRPRGIVLVVLVLLALGFAANALWGRADPVLGDPRAPVLLAWTSDRLLPQLGEAARRADGIGAVVEVRNGVGWISSWESDDGDSTQAPQGFRIPLEIMAIDPEAYSAFIPEDHKSAFVDLAEGGAMLSATGASLRGIRETGSLTFAEATIPVTGVVPDELVASHEVVMSSATAAGLGIDDPKYFLLEMERWTSRQEVEERLREQLEDGARLGLRGPGESAVFRPGGNILSQAQIKDIFGEFAGRRGSGRAIEVDPAWILENTSNATVPLLGTVRCHNKIIPQLRGAFEEIVEKGLGSLVQRGDFGGCFAPRFLNSDPHSGLSHHAWGIAFDFNVSRNPYGAEPAMDLRLVELLERWGFTWGGHWAVPDGMHFEYLRDPD
ncbi:MAG TPA: M15 family metallopeptidase [Actinomycetota bacterium]|nr:M15 family metallopeptidase [Actinomycetota bacterium]